MLNQTCCFFGHRTITETEELRTKVSEAIERLITDEEVDTFLFGTPIALKYAEKKGKTILLFPKIDDAL